MGSQDPQMPPQGWDPNNAGAQPGWNQHHADGQQGWDPNNAGAQPSWDQNPAKEKKSNPVMTVTRVVVALAVAGTAIYFGYKQFSQ